MPSMVKADPVAAEEWKALCGWLADMKILAKSDRSLMVSYVTTYSEWLKAYQYIQKNGVSCPTAAGSVTTAPEAHHYHKLSDRLLKLLVELGLTPSARSRIKAPDQQDIDDPFQNLLDRFSGKN